MGEEAEKLTGIKSFGRETFLRLGCYYNWSIKMEAALHEHYRIRMIEETAVEDSDAGSDAPF